jgi:hypothetical protein
MNMKPLLFLSIVVVIVFNSCSTDVELNAPYKNTTIIFGLLDPDFNGDNVINQLDTQWIKINRTFLGEGDNTQYAAVRDSSEYTDEDFVSKKVQRIVEGDVVEEYPLISKTVSNRSLNGIFYGPEQTLYYFIPSNTGLNQFSDYRIILNFTDGREVSATTPVIKYTSFSWLTPQPNATIIMATQSTPGQVIYTPEVTVKWNAAANALVYDARLKFYYTELLYDNDAWSGTPISTTEKSIEFYIGSVTKDVITEGEQLKITFGGETFFSFLENNIEVNNRIRRVIGHFDTAQQRTECFDLLLTLGDGNLKSYIEVNTPSSGIVQERPIYTNIENGIGLFASRGSRNLISLPLISVDNNNQPSPGNLVGLIQSHTVALNFCDPNPTSDYYCD